MKRYKIRTFSQYMGVTVDTVKHYQQCGILKPEIDPENNYRYYNITHGERLIVSRRFRNLGFTIEDTKDLISTKNGQEIHDLLARRYADIETEIKQLEENARNLRYLTELCDLFNHRCETYDVCMCPGYYFYRHTFNLDFIEEGSHELLTKELMAQLPNAVKMMILPYESMLSRKNKNYYHTIALREDLSSCVCDDDLAKLEFTPAHPAIRYIYSRPHSHEKTSFICDLYEEFTKQGYDLSQEDILIENAIDYYVDGIRYENYLIYFPLKS